MEWLMQAAVLAAVLGALFGLVMVIKPFGPFKKRWQGGLIAFGSFLVFGFLQDRPPERPSHISDADWTERRSICDQANMLRECPLDDAMVAEARERVAANAVEEQARAAEEEERAAATVLDDAFRATDTELRMIGGECDAQIEMMSVMFDSAQPGSAYGSAATAAETCARSADRMETLHFDEPLSDEARTGLDPIFACYADAYRQKARAARSVMAYLDDRRPSLSHQVNRDSQQAVDAVRACHRQYAAAAAEHGFEATPTDR